MSATVVIVSALWRRFVIALWRTRRVPGRNVDQVQFVESRNIKTSWFADLLQ